MRRARATSPAGARPYVRCSALLLLALALSSVPAAAQEERYAPLILQLPASARAAGLGGAVVALRDIDAIFGNPALAGTMTGATLSLARFSRHAAGGALAASPSIGAFNVSIGAQWVGFESVGVGVPVGSRVLTSSGSGEGASMVGTFALNTVFRSLRWGAAVKYVDERIVAGSDGAATLDLGVATQGQTTYALAVQNIGSSVEIGTGPVELPLRVSLGASRFFVPVGPLDVGATVSVSVLRRDLVTAAAGMEWAYTPLDGYNFAVRAGVRRPELREQQPFSGGASFTLDRVTLDYAVEDLARGAAHRLALRIR